MGTNFSPKIPLGITKESPLIPYLAVSALEKDLLLNKPEINNLIAQLIYKEKELSKNYYTFFHGQRREYFPFEQLNSYLDSIVSNLNRSREFLHLHVRENVNDLEKGKTYKKAFTL